MGHLQAHANLHRSPCSHIHHLDVHAKVKDEKLRKHHMPYPCKTMWNSLGPHYYPYRLAFAYRKLMLV